MARLVVSAAGAAIGFMVAGPTGAQIGWAAGGLIGSAFEPAQKSEGPRLGDLSVGTSSYGTPIPYIAGHPRVAGQIVWASNKREISTTTSQGKGGGGSEYTSYTYEVDLLILLSDNELDGVARVWSNGELAFDGVSILNNAWSRMTFYSGGSAQLPDPDYEAAVGIANAPAYRGRGSVFIKSLQLGGSGQIPNLTFEVATGIYAFTPAPVYNNVLLQSDLPTAITLDESCQSNRGTSVTSTYYTGAGASTWSLQGDGGAGQVDGFGWTNMTAFAGGDITLEVKITASTPIGTPGPSTSAAPFFSITAGSNINSADWSVQLMGDYGNGSLYVNIHYVGQVVVPASFPGDIAFAIVQPAVPSASTPTKMYVNGVMVWAYAGRAITQTAYTIVFGGKTSNRIVGQSYVFKYHGIRVRRGLFPNDLSYGPYDAPLCVTLPAQPIGSPVNDTIENVVSEILQRANPSASWYDTTALSTITRPVRSMAVSSVSTARTILEMLSASYFFEAVLSDKLYFRPRGGAPVATVTFNELGVMQDSNNPPDPLPLTQSNELEIPAQMALTYNNTDGDYQTDTQYSDRLLTGMESTSAVTLPMGFTASEGKQIVDAMLFDKAVSALSTRISVGGMTRANLEPTDVILLVGEDGSTYRTRIVKRSDSGGIASLDCVLDDASVLTQSGTTAGGTASQTTVLAVATTSLQLLDVPLLRDADNFPGHYIAMTGSATNWTNAALYESADDLTYSLNTTISSQAPMGTCSTTLAPWSGGDVFDEVNTLTVNVGLQQLVSVTRDDILNSQSINAAVVGFELIQYRSALLVSAGVYTLSGLLRGRRGTGWATSIHLGSERFVALGNSGVRFIELQSSDLGRLKYYKGASASQKLSAVTSQSMTPAGIALKPFSPVGCRANRTTTDTALTWTRRTRLSTRMTGTLGINVPLGEASESYEVEVYASGAFATVKRTLNSSTPSVTYTSAQQVTDFGSNQATLYLKIYQLSATVGRGYPLTITL
jgi:hypothetical protein